MLIQALGSYSDGSVSPQLRSIQIREREECAVDTFKHRISVMLQELFDIINEPGFGEYIEIYIDGEKVIEYTK